MPEQFLVMKAEHVAGSDSFDSVEAALGHAALKTKSDKEPRFVLRVTAQVSPDPVPAVVITRFDEGIDHEESH